MKSKLMIFCFFATLTALFAEDFVWRGQYRPNMFTPTMTAFRQMLKA